MKTLKIILMILSLPLICIYAVGFMLVIGFAMIIGEGMDQIFKDPAIREWVIEQIES